MNEAAHKVLVVDDDMRLRDLLSRYLHEQGFGVKVVADGAGLTRAMDKERFDLVVLDLMLPGEDGWAICQRLRALRNPIPIIMLTAKGAEEDRIAGLDMGADDYLAKPFNPRELVSRIHAVLRRRGNLPPPGAPERDAAKITWQDFCLDLGSRSLTREGRPVPLTTGEFAMLKVLAGHPRVPLSREKLMELARGRDLESYDRAVDVQISRLRKLIEPDPAHPRFIQTVWGFGYVFVPDAQKAGTS
jgi:two-component system phosphate regulon response regulator OmpR